MFAYFESTLGWRELLKRTAKETMADDALGLAAQLAYYFFLALFPAILALLALASFFPIHNFTDQVTATLGRFAPPEMLSLIREQLTNLSGSADAGILSVGFVGALWSSSAALVGLIGALNRAYDIEESRPWWKVRLIAILLTTGLALFIVLAFTLVVAGPELGETLALRIGMGDVFIWTWKVLQWPIAFALVAVAIGLVYYFAPDADQDWVWVSPGAVAATTLWLICSLIFRFYIVNFGSYQQTYGVVGSVIVLMLWFYLSGLCLIVGAEMAAEIEYAAPWAKNPGEKVAGQRKKIGLAAGRAYQERQRQLSRERPLPPPRNVSEPIPATAASLRSSWGDQLLGMLIALVWPRVRRGN
jgi:membrane protein